VSRKRVRFANQWDNAEPIPSEKGHATAVSLIKKARTMESVAAVMAAAASDESRHGEKTHDGVGAPSLASWNAV
jgi:hypothetical protein